MHDESAIALTQIGPVAFEARIPGRDWVVKVDLAAEQGGGDVGPSPTELLAISLAACKAMTAVIWAKHRGIALDQVGAEVTKVFADAPRRVSEFDVNLSGVRTNVPETLWERMERGVQNCIVARTLEHSAVIRTQIE